MLYFGRLGWKSLWGRYRRMRHPLSLCPRERHPRLRKPPRQLELSLQVRLHRTTLWLRARLLRRRTLQEQRLLRIHWHCRVQLHMHSWIHRYIRFFGLFPNPTSHITTLIHLIRLQHLHYLRSFNKLININPRKNHWRVEDVLWFTSCFAITAKHISLINWSLWYDLHRPFSPAERMISHCFNVLTYRLIHLNSIFFLIVLI